ncbi:L-lysine 2,3-aminomutase [Serratia fonticola]|uniref:L-lysine 2,3-aminomutase n=1 Tax=Serratia fonticola TaxID=47917 RepID=A0A4U9VUP4_SERFO|nr:L-lysine 2,3-aminomutase [Serratia fonticola]
MHAACLRYACREPLPRVCNPVMPMTRCCARYSPPAQEFIDAPGFTTDPLDEQRSVVPGLLHKYRNRALLLVKGGCAVNCRYCFRRHFPYQENQGNKAKLASSVGVYPSTPGTG